MATKPVTLPRPWATNAVYATGPFAGSPGKVDPGVGVAAEGHRPGAANSTAAEHENYQQNLVTASWIPWVNSGSSAGAADAHLVETDASGRSTLHGLDVIDPSNETAVNITGANTAAPTVFIRNTSSGPVVSITTSSASAGTLVGVSMVGAHSGSGVSVDGTATSSGTLAALTGTSGATSKCLVITQGANANALQVNGTFSGGPGSTISQVGGAALTLTATGGTGTPLVLTPRNVSPATAGSFWIDNLTNTPRYYDSGPTLKDVWASVSGAGIASTFTAGPTTHGVLVTAATNNTLTMVNGQRYVITMGADLGRVAASASNVLVTATVNGVALPFSGYTVQLFQAGAANQLERTWMKSVIYTATVTGNLVINLQFTPTAAGQTIYAQAFITVMGHYP